MEGNDERDNGKDVINEDYSMAEVDDVVRIERLHGFIGRTGRGMEKGYEENEEDY